MTYTQRNEPGHTNNPARSNKAHTHSITPAEDLVSDGLMTVEETAQFLGLSRSTVYKLTESGELSYVKIGRSRRIPRKAVSRLAARNMVGVFDV